MKYRDIPYINRQEAKAIFSESDEVAIANALLSITMYDEDWKWVQSYCLKFLEHNSSEIKRTAIVCLSHLVRIHRRLDLDKVMSVLTKFSNIEEFSGSIDDLLDDIEIFLKK